MTKVFGCLSVLTVCGVSLWAQSAGGRDASTNRASQIVKDLAGAPSDMAPNDMSVVAQPPILNIMTVVGNDVLGLPCLDCLLNFLVPDLGLPSPLGKVVQGSSYQIDAYLIDNTYTGPCTFNFAVRDLHQNVVVSTTQTLDEKANSAILLSAPITIPNTFTAGLGSASTTAVCGESATKSSSPVFLACVQNPPFCVD
jgi:hypothetical protein